METYVNEHGAMWHVFEPFTALLDDRRNPRMTEYLVLAKPLQADTWAQIGPDRVEARSARSAIQEALKNRADVEGYETFVAVPARSWRPVSVKVETKTALR